MGAGELQAMGKSDVELSLFLRDMARHAAAMVKSVAAAATAGAPSGSAVAVTAGAASGGDGSGSGSGSGSGGGSDRRAGAGSGAIPLAPTLASNAPAAVAAAAPGVAASDRAVVCAAHDGNNDVPSRGSRSGEMGGEENVAGRVQMDGRLPLAVPPIYHATCAPAVAVKAEPLGAEALLPSGPVDPSPTPAGPRAHSPVPTAVQPLQGSSTTGFQAGSDAGRAAGRVLAVPIAPTLSSSAVQAASLEGSGRAGVEEQTHSATKKCKLEGV